MRQKTVIVCHFYKEIVSSVLIDHGQLSPGYHGMNGYPPLNVLNMRSLYHSHIQTAIFDTGKLYHGIEEYCRRKLQWKQ
ncbi:MAG: hypothetical protein K2P59_06900, partial [Acetatifactor sp.]|nr:hypothetical protein [Acetatifactor sp.]